MEKSTSGNGWNFDPPKGDDDRAIWAGKDSIYNPSFNREKFARFLGKPLAIACLIWIAWGFSASDAGAMAVFLAALLIACLFFVYSWLSQRMGQEWLGSAWQLVASGDDLTYRGGSSWSVSVDEIARVESGQTVEWERARQYAAIRYKTGSAVARFAAKNEEKQAIPDAEMQVFIFTDDGRRLVVHTANAAREDCGRLAHSIRSYVETQRGNAAPSPSSSDTSSPAPDGFDL